MFNVKTTHYEVKPLERRQKFSFFSVDGTSLMTPELTYTKLDLKHISGHIYKDNRHELNIT